MLLAAALTLALLVCSTALPFAYGFLSATLVWLTPTMRGKLWVARPLVVTPFRILSKELAAEVRQEVEWIVNARHGPIPESHRKLLAVAWGK